MATMSSIEWTEATWNPVTGCSKVSPGCKHCYAERMAKRLEAMGQPRYRNGFRVTQQEDIVDLPLKWRKPRLVFVNSMSDLFHEAVEPEFIGRVFDTMRAADWHTFQVLTKRPERVLELADQLPWPPNVWMGTSVENEQYTWRIDALREVRAAVRFLSLEPLLGPLDNLCLTGIHWVIVGGESGPRARPMKEAWVHRIREQCEESAVPFFFKQWGGVQKSRAGRELDGREWNEMPASRRSRDSLPVLSSHC